MKKFSLILLLLPLLFFSCEDEIPFRPSPDPACGPPPSKALPSFTTIETTPAGLNNSLIAAKNGNFLISANNMGRTQLVHEIDAEGNVIWSTGYLFDDYGTSRALIQDDENNIYVLGFVEATTFPERENMSLLKLDESGTFLWSKVFGSEEHVIPSGIVFTSDNRLMISGIAQQSLGGAQRNSFLLWLNKEGEVIEEKRFEEGLRSGIFDLSSINGNEIVTTGSTGDWSDEYAITSKYLADGTLDWEVLQGNGYTKSQAVILLKDGDILICGIQESSEKIEDQIFLSKISRDGEVQWFETIDEMIPLLQVSSVQENADGSFIIAAAIQPCHSLSNMILINTDGSGKNEKITYFENSAPIRPMNMIKIDGDRNLLTGALIDHANSDKTIVINMDNEGN